MFHKILAWLLFNLKMLNNDAQDIVLSSFFTVQPDVYTTVLNCILSSVN